MRSRSLAKTLLKSRDKLPDKVVNALKLEIAKTYNMKPDRIFDTFLEALLSIKSLKYIIIKLVAFIKFLYDQLFL